MFIWHELSQRETKQNTVQQIWRNKEDITASHWISV